MANPQPDQFTKWSNALLEEYEKAPLTGGEFRVLLMVIRETYGYHTKIKELSVKYILKSTGLSRDGFYKARKSLINRKMLKTYRKTYIHTGADQWKWIEISTPERTTRAVGYGIQKDYDKWILVRRNVLMKNSTSPPDPSLIKKDKTNIKEKRQEHTQPPLKSPPQTDKKFIPRRKTQSISKTAPPSIFSKISKEDFFKQEKILIKSIERKLGGWEKGMPYAFLRAQFKNGWGAHIVLQVLEIMDTAGLKIQRGQWAYFNNTFKKHAQNIYAAETRQTAEKEKEEIHAGYSKLEELARQTFKNI